MIKKILAGLSVGIMACSLQANAISMAYCKNHNDKTVIIYVCCRSISFPHGEPLWGPDGQPDNTVFHDGCPKEYDAPVFVDWTFQTSRTIFQDCELRGGDKVIF